MDKNKVMLIAIIALLIVLIGIIVAAVIMLPSMINKQNEPAEATVEPSISLEDVSLIKIEDPIKTNLKESPGGEKHVISAEFSVGIDMSTKESQAFYDRLTEQNTIIKDVILSCVRNNTFEDLQKADAQEILRGEILSRLQEEFNSNLIIRVYVSSIFMQ